MYIASVAFLLGGVSHQYYASNPLILFPGKSGLIYLDGGNDRATILFTNNVIWHSGYFRLFFTIQHERTTINITWAHTSYTWGYS